MLEKNYRLAASKIIELLENDRLRRIMGVEGKRIALKKFDWKILISKCKEIFRNG